MRSYIYEVMVESEFQRMGIASHMLQLLEAVVGGTRR